MTVEYITSFEDFSAAQALYLRSRKRAGLRFKLWMYGLPTLALLFTAGALWDIYTGQSRTGGAFSVLAAYTLLLTILVVVLRPWNLKRVYKKQRKTWGTDSFDEAIFGFDETAVRSGYSGKREGQFNWDSIVDYAEDPKVFLLFISKKAFLYIPKRAMNEEQWQSLRELLQRNGKELAC